MVFGLASSLVCSSGNNSILGAWSAHTRVSPGVRAGMPVSMVVPPGRSQPGTHTVGIWFTLDQPATDGYDSHKVGQMDEYSGEIRRFSFQLEVYWRIERRTRSISCAGVSRSFYFSSFRRLMLFILFDHGYGSDPENGRSPARGHAEKYHGSRSRKSCPSVRRRAKPLGDIKEKTKMPFTEPEFVTSQNGRNQILQVIIAFSVFCGLSYMGQISYAFFVLAVFMGLALPLIWGKVKGNWIEMGFTKENLWKSLVWGVATGILASLIGVAVIPQTYIPSEIGLQLAIGFPIWILIASPFQEFFFRGWIQSRLTGALGLFWGIFVSTILFTLWHYFAPFIGNTPVPLNTLTGFLSTFGAGLLYALAFQRTRNIIAPWLAHALTGIIFILIGAMDFTQPIM